MTAIRKHKGSEEGIDCCICGGTVDLHRDLETGRVFWDQGHNAWPIKEGRCCDNCQMAFVFPKRLQLAQESSPDDWSQTGPRFALEGLS